VAQHGGVQGKGERELLKGGEVEDLQVGGWVGCVSWVTCVGWVSV